MSIDNLVKLDDISKEYFNVSPRIARTMAGKGTLPVPAFRLSASRKGPYFVRTEDLDKLVAERVGEAKKLQSEATEV